MSCFPSTLFLFPFPPCLPHPQPPFPKLTPGRPDSPAHWWSCFTWDISKKDQKVLSRKMPFLKFSSRHCGNIRKTKDLAARFSASGLSKIPFPNCLQWNDSRGQLWNTRQFQMDSDFWFLHSQPLLPGDHPGIFSQAQAEPLSRVAKESSCLRRVRKCCWFLPSEEPAQPLSGCHH